MPTRAHPISRFVLPLCLGLMTINPAQSEAINSLLGTWYLEQFQSSSDNQPLQRPSIPREFSLTFASDGNAYMRLGCNRAFGTWESEVAAGGESGQLAFGPLAGTRALCSPPRLDELVTTQAPYIRSFLLENNRLHLSLMADGGIFSWTRHSGPRGIAFTPLAPEEGGPRNWEVVAGAGGLNLRQQPSVSSQVLGSYPSGTLLDNLGCESKPDRTWCDVQKLGGGAPGYVAADYLQPAISPNGDAIFGLDDSALRAGQGDFDASAEILCEEEVGVQQRCLAKVARSGGGYATLVVTKPSGGERVFYFSMGRLIGVNTSEADYPGELKFTREGDRYEVNLGSERYSLVDALILGG